IITLHVGSRQTSCERGNVQIALCADAVTSEQADNCLQQDSQIQKQALVIDVPYVQSESLIPAQRVATFDLVQACNPWLNFMTTGLLRSIELQVFKQQRARADQAHFSG